MTKRRGFTQSEEGDKKLMNEQGYSTDRNKDKVEYAMEDRQHNRVEDCVSCDKKIALTDVAGHYSGICRNCRRKMES